MKIASENRTKSHQSASVKGLLGIRRNKCCCVLLTVAILCLLCTLIVDSLGMFEWIGGDVSKIVILSLLRGFTPIIGSGIFILIAAVLYFVLFFSVEKILSVENNPEWDRSKSRKKYSFSRNSSIPVGTHYLSLREHSPPPIVIFRF